ETINALQNRSLGYLLRFRAPVRACKIFNLNREELWLLLALYAWLQYRGQQVGSKTHFFECLSGNSRLWRKFEGYYQGLLKKGMIGAFEYIKRPGTLSLGITAKGMSAIKVHNEYTNELEGRYRIDNARSLDVDESPPAKYRKIA